MTEFRTVANVSEIAPGEMKLVDLDGERVVVANVDGQLYAFNNMCPHAGGPLVEGELEGETVTCPWHATMFSVRTGEALEGVTGRPVPVYELRVEGQDVQLRKP